MKIFSIIYICLWVALIAVEIVGATTNYRTLDTMSENWWYVQDKFPIVARAVMTVGLVVLWYHLVLSKGIIK